MRIFRDMEMVEQLGSGLPRILQRYGEECFYFSESYTRMIFYAEEKINRIINSDGGLSGGLSGGLIGTNDTLNGTLRGVLNGIL